MRLHEDRELFKDAVSITAEYKGLPEIYVEKDYWITLVLQRIFQGPLGKHTVFKGGTALSKCFSYINRFSEDIDLVIIKEPGLSANQLKERLKQISSLVSELMPEIETIGITNKKGMIRKTVHSYAKTFTGDFGQVRDMIILETSWLGSSQPANKGKVYSFIYEMMVFNGQADLAAEYGLAPFEVSVLAPQRTLCEKIMSLVRFSHTENPVKDLRSKVRHVYDLHQMLGQDDLSDFFNSPDFDQMLYRVARDDRESFRNSNEWLYIPPSEALVFSSLERIWPELAAAYHGSFRTLVFGSLPTDDSVKKSMQRISDRIAQIDWQPISKGS
ncbi:nucleotidyl transferase AbiEii/AbiGii toxin family protein [Dyadobacter sp. LJ419]|uniref:Nucleotidyl transferase AbiEii/AbiGii toxin family protein n=2 Tax=Dyadobacter chenwenxiniae TaxID=2906456 RepID=A0A9X1TE49_9BACT|nr:nucleotidyl transferase AbiEii/AbiGii toxin family protein [Dyadobacter chenwenxiniae]